MSPAHKTNFVPQPDGSLRVDVELTGGCQPGTRTLEGVAVIYQPEHETNPIIQIPKGLGVDFVAALVLQVRIKEWEIREDEEL